MSRQEMKFLEITFQISGGGPRVKPAGAKCGSGADARGADSAVTFLKWGLEIPSRTSSSCRVVSVAQWAGVSEPRIQYFYHDQAARLHNPEISVHAMLLCCIIQSPEIPVHARLPRPQPQRRRTSTVITASCLRVWASCFSATDFVVYRHSLGNLTCVSHV